MSNPGSLISTESSLSEDLKNKNKENNDKQGSYGVVLSKRNRYKRRIARKNDDKVYMKGSNLNLKGYYYQYYGKPSHKLNQFTRTTNKIQEEFNRDYEVVHLIESLFRGEDINLTELKELDDKASRGLFIR